MNNPQLMEQLRFNASDLQLNRNGRLSEKQKETLQLKEKGAKAGSLFLGLIFTGAALLGLGIAISTVFTSDSFILKAIIGGVFGCIWPLIWGAAGFFTLKRAFTKSKRKLKKRKVPSIS